MKPTAQFNGFSKAVRHFLTGAMLLGLLAFAQAGDIWDGGGANNKWSTGNNWSPNGDPANNGTANITFSGSTGTSPDLDKDWDINSLTFASGAASFTLGGNKTLTIQGGGITVSSANAQTIAHNIALGAAQTWNAASGNLTISGAISGTGGITKAGTGTLNLGNANNSFSGGFTQSAGSTVVNPAASFGVPTAGTSSYLGQQGITISGGTLQLAPTGAGNDFTGINRNVTINGGTLQLAPNDEVQGIMSAGTLTFGSSGGRLEINSRLANNVQLGSVAVNASAGSPGVIAYSTIANTTGNAGWDAGGRDINVANLSGTGSLKFELTGGAAVDYQQANFGGSLTFSGVSGGDAGANSTSTSVGRLSFTTTTPIAITGGLTFENVMQVTVYNAERVIDSAITIRSGATTAFQGRATAAAANDDIILGAAGTTKSLTIESGATAIMDTRYRDDVANIGGVTLNLNTDIAAGGTLRFTRSQAGGNVDDHTVNGDITGSGTSGSDSVVDLLLGAGGSGGGINFTAGAGTAGSDLIVNGTGTGGLRIQGTQAAVDNLLTSARMQDLTGSGGTLTVAYSDNGTGTFATGPSAPSNVRLGFDSQGGSSPTYQLGSTHNDLANFNGLVVKGGTVVANANQAFQGAGTTTLDLLGGTLQLGGGAGAYTLTFEGDANLTGGTLYGGSPGGFKGTLTVGGNLNSSGSTLVNSPNITMMPVSGTTAVQGTTPLTGVGVFTKAGAGTTRLDQELGASLIGLNEGTLLLGGNNRIADSTPMRLSGGTFATGGYGESLGVLTLTADSSIDLGAGASVLTFANSSGTWTAGQTISVYNWSGVTGGGGTDQLIFNSALSAAEIGQIEFVNPAGFAPGTYAAQLVGLEVVPVPEPGTLAALALLAVGIAWRDRNRLRRVLTRRLTAKAE